MAWAKLRGGWSHCVKSSRLIYFSRRTMYGSVKYVVYTDVSREEVRQAIEHHAREMWGAQVTDLILKEDDRYAETPNTVVVTATIYSPSGSLIGR